MNKAKAKILLKLYTIYYHSKLFHLFIFIRNQKQTGIELFLFDIKLLFWILVQFADNYNQLIWFIVIYTWLDHVHMNFKFPKAAVTVFCESRKFHFRSPFAEKTKATFHSWECGYQINTCTWPLINDLLTPYYFSGRFHWCSWCRIHTYIGFTAAKSQRILFFFIFLMKRYQNVPLEKSKRKSRSNEAKKKKK